MKLWDVYHRPATVDEALHLLKQHRGKARVIAGGTDLLVEMRAGHHEPHEALVDVTSIDDLNHIQQEGDEIVIGAGVTHSAIVASPLLVREATCLVESCGVVGGPQVRNVATLGGNVAHALPAGDGTTALVALDARAEIVKDGQQMIVPIAEMFLGPGKSLIDPTRDLLLSLRFRAGKDSEASAFKRVMRPQGVALPVLGCAIWVKLDETRQRITSSRVCITPVAPTPQRASEVESYLAGKIADDALIQEAAELAQATLHPRTSKYRATADYRKELTAVLTRRTLALALTRARTGTAVPESAS